MKNKKIYIVSFLLTLVCSACNDWLDVDPKDRVREEKQYSNEDYINSALNGLYRQMAGENLYGGQLSQTSIEAMAHYYVYSSATANMSSDVIFQFSNWNYTGDKAKSKLLNIWKSGYGTLLNINNYIKGVNESPAVLSKEHRNLLLGEAYGLRAYLHFDLFRLFGPYPYNANATDKVLPYNREADITLNLTDMRRMYIARKESISVSCRKIWKRRSVCCWTTRFWTPLRKASRTLYRTAFIKTGTGG